jgi:hypothetical protein
MKGETQPPVINDPVEADTTPRELVVRPWIDTQVEAHGFGPRSMYVETCWLPVLGPTATWLYRRLGSWMEFNPDGLSIDLRELGEGLGLGSGIGRQSPLMRSVDRLTRFGAARWAGTQLQVRRALAPLTQGHVSRLSETNRRLHDEYVRQLGRHAVNGNGAQLIK